jgi:hypothetical protein
MQSAGTFGGTQLTVLTLFVLATTQAWRSANELESN